MLWTRVVKERRRARRSEKGEEVGLRDGAIVRSRCWERGNEEMCPAATELIARVRFSSCSNRGTFFGRLSKSWLSLSRLAGLLALFQGFLNAVEVTHNCQSATSYVKQKNAVTT